jgi:hypothetical protein
LDLYDTDSNEIWNRVYTTLMVRAEDRNRVDDDPLDPPLWARTRFLLQGETNRRAVAVLNELTEDQRSLARRSPLQRAVMQRDLIAAFTWATGDHVRSAPEPTREQHELAAALAHAIRHIALEPDAIRHLPDNYAAALNKPGTSLEFDPGHPERPFLPKDLLDEHGPWILLSAEGDIRPAAPVHVESFQNRSAFEIRFRHAGGRAAGEAYLRELAALKSPAVIEKPDHGNVNGDTGPWPNPDTPQFPSHSFWALVRRAILSDRAGNPVVSPLVESVQVRAYLDVQDSTPLAQTAFEWALSRKLLFGPGGFHRVTPDDEVFSHFLSKGVDPYEEYGFRTPPHVEQTALTCLQCHNKKGIHSVLSRSWTFLPGSWPATLQPTMIEDLNQRTYFQARRSPNWVLLKWMPGSEGPRFNAGER